MYSDLELESQIKSSNQIDSVLFLKLNKILLYSRTIFDRVTLNCFGYIETILGTSASRDLGSNQIKTFPSGIISPSILVSLTEMLVFKSIRNFSSFF